MLPLLILISCISHIIEASVFFENNEVHRVHIGIEVEKLLESKTSSFQQIDVYKTVRCGNMLVLDGAIQLTEWDNAPYHEMITHVPLMTHPCPRKVLVIGGGDGGVLTEVLKHETVEEIILCEIDADVIELSKKYFKDFAPSFNDPRVTVIIENSANYIKLHPHCFDVIIIDASDPVGPASVLYSEEFYRDIHSALKKNGIVAAQAESMFFDLDNIIIWHKRNESLFKHASYYYALVPSYPSGVIGFAICSKVYNPRDFHYDQHRDLSEMHYYSPAIHSSSFTLPAFLEKKLAQSTRPVSISS